MGAEIRGVGNIEGALVRHEPRFFLYTKPYRCVVEMKMNAEFGEGCFLIHKYLVFSQ